MLCLSPQVGFLREPFNPSTSAGISSGPFDRYHVYVTAENEGAFVRPLERTIGFRYALGPQVRSIRSRRDAAWTVRDLVRFTRYRVRHMRPLIKDPIAVFSSEWLVSRFGVQPVVLIRHPAAFASSLVRLGWAYDFHGLLAQPLLMRDHLVRFEDEIREFAERPPEVLDQAILLWRLIYGTVATFRERHPEWLFLRHEDLSRDPVRGFASLYEALGLPFDDGIGRTIASHSGKVNPWDLQRLHDVRLDSRAGVESWQRRLTPEQVERVRTGVADVSPRFYSDDDW